MDYNLDRCKFQSARPIRGATDYAQTAKGRPLFQSTRPVRGATRSVSFRGPVSSEFQSSRPVRGATVMLRQKKTC